MYRACVGRKILRDSFIRIRESRSNRLESGSLLQVVTRMMSMMMALAFTTETLVEETKRWLFRVFVTLVIAVGWHWFTQTQPPPTLVRRSYEPSTRSTPTVACRSQQKLLQELDPVPNDLELKETVSDDAAHNSPHSAKLVRIETPETVVVDESIESKAQAPTAKRNDNENQQKSSQARSQSAPLSFQSALPPFQATTDKHPGLQAFWDWCNVQNSLFRVYTVGRTDNVPVVPPYNPSSRRGLVSVALQVTNATATTIAVYWVDYKGREQPKGRILPQQLWTQTTWMEHPWVFRDDATDGILLHYIPYRVLPTLPDSPTVDPNDPTVGLHRFTIRSALTASTTVIDDPYHHCVTIDDPILPFPAQLFLKTPTASVSWTLWHCRRMSLDASVYATLVKYLTKIVQHAQIQGHKFRQIRTANSNFHAVWQTPARGLLLAVGFVENGAHVELGSAGPLSTARVQDIALLLFQVEQCQRQAAVQQQPTGADGFGRAGWGRADGRNA